MSEQSGSWQEEWRLHLHEDKEECSKIRGYLQFGGRLSLKEHFLPGAKAICEESGLSLLGVTNFKTNVNLSNNIYTVSAFVTLKRNSQ